MKFCDKLAKLRKDNNLSQEQFADKMNVSRQAVSKWESGSSYPDMDKILNMCKILNCNLDDLLDDGVIGNTKSNKINFNDYFNEFLNFITKTYNMFWSMKFKEKVKCLIELFVIFFVLFMLGLIIYSIVYNLFIYNFNEIKGIGFIVNNIIDPLIIVALIIIGIIIFIHLFKIRYLNYFITIEDNEVKEKTKEKALEDEKVIDNKKYIVESPKQKIVIRDPKHSTLGFLNVLVKIVLYIIKFFVIMFVVPFIIFVIIMIAMSAISVSFIKYGIIFLFIFLAFLGVILISFIILNFAYNFIFNKEIKFKLMFILFISGLILIGVGSGLSAVNFMNFKYEEVSSKDYVIKEEVIEMKDNLVISGEYEENYIIDNSLEDIKVKIGVPSFAKYAVTIHECDNYEIYDIYYNGVTLDAYKIFIDEIKNKKIINYETPMTIDIYISQKNYDIIKNNSDNYY